MSAESLVNIRVQFLRHGRYRLVQIVNFLADGNILGISVAA
jgi:hypothetical protein